MLLITNAKYITDAVSYIIYTHVIHVVVYVNINR